VAQAARCGAATLREAIDMTCRNPTRFFGLAEYSLRPGHPADVFVYDPEPSKPGLGVLATVIAGEVRHGSIPAVR
jgi:dihydroorotase-like cyclic amidohydrolase